MQHRATQLKEDWDKQQQHVEKLKQDVADASRLHDESIAQSNKERDAAVDRLKQEREASLLQLNSERLDHAEKLTAKTKVMRAAQETDLQHRKELAIAYVQTRNDDQAEFESKLQEKCAEMKKLGLKIAQVTCSKDGCKALIRARGFCYRHCPDKPKCTFSGCTNGAVANKLCYRHKAYGECTHEGCEAAARTRTPQLCQKHASALRTLQSQKRWVSGKYQSSALP